MVGGPEERLPEGRREEDAPGADITTPPGTAQTDLKRSEPVDLQGSAGGQTVRRALEDGVHDPQGFGAGNAAVEASDGRREIRLVQC